MLVRTMTLLYRVGMIDVTPLQTRRAFLRRTTAGLTALAAVPLEGLAAGETAAAATVEVDPTPHFVLSPHLYMQFMESPLHSGRSRGCLRSVWGSGWYGWRWPGWPAVSPPALIWSTVRYCPWWACSPRASSCTSPASPESEIARWL